MTTTFFGFGEARPGYDVPVLSEREARAAAGIMLLLATIAAVNAGLLGNFLPMRLVVTLFFIDFALRVLVNPSGASQSVQVYRSSGHPRLDEAAVQAILRWTFVPAERGRRPVMAWLLVPVRFAGGAYVTIDESAVIGG